MYIFIKQIFRFKKPLLFKLFVYSEFISELNICLPIYLILLHFFQLSVSLIYNFFCIYCCVPTNFQFKIPHIFCSHSIYLFYMIYFGCLCCENFPSKNIQFTISQFSTQVAGSFFPFLMPLFSPSTPLVFALAAFCILIYSLDFVQDLYLFYFLFLCESIIRLVLFTSP